MPTSARPINEITGVKKPSSVLVRGFSAMDIAKQAGLIPGWYNEEQFIASLRGPNGYSTFDLWTQIAGNEAKTIDDFWIFLGLNEAIATGLALDQLAADVVALAISSAAVEDAASALALAAAVDTSGLATKADPELTGLVNIKEKLALSGDISPTQLVANTDDWAPTGLAAASIVRASTDATRELRGLTGGSDGRVIFLQNVGANRLKLMNEAASSTAANRFSIVEDMTLRSAQMVLLVYDSTTSRWRASRWNSKATVAEIIAGVDDEAFTTSKGLADAAAFVAADAGEISSNTWTPNMALGVNRSWTLTGNKILASPIGMKDGLTYTWKFKQDATGGRTLTLPSSGIQFNFGAAGVWAPNTGANKVNYLSGLYDAAESRIIVNGIVSA